MVNFTVLRNFVRTSSKIIRHFENSQLIFTCHVMASMCAKFHCYTISSLENARARHSPPPHPKINYATPDTPNKTGLTQISKCSVTKKRQLLISIYCINATLPYKGLICKFVKKSALTC